ncbi:MAG: hypothetical protein O2963_00040 [Proteobacteria bacterium]|nr:hypothetical protein [Pseudomonadota bacterium]
MVNNAYEKRMELKLKLDELDKHLTSTLNNLTNNRSSLVQKVRVCEEQIAEYKESISQIDSEVAQILLDSGKDEEIVYNGGFRFEFKEEMYGTISEGHEKQALDWANELGRHDLVKISVGKRSFNSLVGEGIELPNFISANTFRKFNVRKDTRKDLNKNT